MTKQQRKELELAERRAVERGEGEPTHEGVMWVPQVDIFEDRDSITLRADLPGARREDVDIDVRDGILSLTAQVAGVPSSWRPVYGEYQVGGFTRRFSLGEKLAPDKITANLDNGVLTLVLPKAEEHRPRKITVG